MRKGSNLKKPILYSRSAWDGTYAVPQAAVQQILGYFPQPRRRRSELSQKKTFHTIPYLSVPCKQFYCQESPPPFFYTVYTVRVSTSYRLPSFKTITALLLPPGLPRLSDHAKFHCH